jgi:hypothetical protein
VSPLGHTASSFFWTRQRYAPWWCVIKLGALRLPFVSYAGPRIVCYLGWQPSGIFGAKFNIKGSAYWICDLC